MSKHLAVTTCAGAKTAASGVYAVTKRKIYPLNVRTTKALREKLEAAAKDNRRSLTQEVEARLIRTLDEDEVPPHSRPEK